MAEETSGFKQGLEDVIAGESSICEVDGQAGRLIYRGYDIHDLATNTTFEEVVYLLWHEDLPTQEQLETLRKDLNAVRPLPPVLIAHLRSRQPRQLHRSQ
jgi:citrate synthase